eukprot:m.134833 g.134833  ORF g.134833 m.134833 type:complete len:371 (+) comp14701_c1_seq2:332-1444(+)
MLRRRLIVVAVALIVCLVGGEERHAKRPDDENYPLPLVPFILNCLTDDGGVEECGDRAPLPRPELLRKSGTESYNTVFQASPYRTTVDEESVLSFLCCYVGEKAGKQLAKIPPRSKNRPYVIWVEEHGWKWNEELTSREDVIFFGFDLRDYALGNNEAPPLPGFSFPPPIPGGYHPRTQYGCTDPRNFFLVFKGKQNLGMYGSSTVRKDLRESYPVFKESYKGPHNIYIEIGLPASSYDKNGPHFFVLMNSTYGLSPRGHGRWSYRFGELLEMMVIPVIMSDGWILPFQNLIDWKKGAVVIKEAAAQGDFNNILDQLPTDPAKIKEMQEYICNVVPKYLGDYKVSAKSAIAAAMRAAEEERGASFVGKTL